MVLDGVNLKDATEAMLLAELLERKGQDGNKLFTAHALSIANNQQLLTSITPNFSVVWTPPAEEE
tara:strand:+ start:492 stop:686 length:195 start_codon:yes stop_codon:yes gene_type:complete